MRKAIIVLAVLVALLGGAFVVRQSGLINILRSMTVSTASYADVVCRHVRCG